MVQVKVGIIGGSGLNDPHIIKNPKEHYVETLFGKPSDALIEGTIEGVPCVVLARHGRNHSIIPSDINYRANIWALKQAGCTHILASSASGGLQDYTQPGDFLVLDQFLDLSKGRESTLYGGQTPNLYGVLHMPMADPFCEQTRKVVIEAARQLSFTVCDRSKGPPSKDAHPCVHTRGSSVTINGPRFSTRFESKLYRSWGLDLVNMTLVPEVSLAREAGMSYVSIAIVTDYDAWKSNDESVCVDGVLSEFKKSVEKVKMLFVRAIKLIGQQDWTATIQANENMIASNRQDLLHNSNGAK